MNQKRLMVGICLLSLATFDAAAAAERTLVLELILNGRPTGKVGEFVDRDGKLFAKPSELGDLGFAMPKVLGIDKQLIALSTLAGVDAHIDEITQSLIVLAADSALTPTELTGADAPENLPLSASGLGAVLNYDTLGTYSDGRTSFDALIDFRAFGPIGVLKNMGIVRLNAVDGQKSYVRLDTTYTYTEPGRMRRWSVGDVTTSALSWSRSLRLAGGKVASDFSLRPDLITYPLPALQGTVATPSTIDVLINGVNQLSRPVQPGPFAIRSIPVVTGAGEIALSVRDALGRERLVVLPFYTSTALLKPGLASYSVEAGLVRKDFGLPNDRYGTWAVMGSSRYGVTNHFTVEGHAEATNGLALLGAGAVVKIGTLGVAEVAVSGSRRSGGAPMLQSINASASGASIAVGLQRSAPGLSLGLRAAYATNGYEDVAAALGSPIRKFTLNANLALRLGPSNIFSLAYIKQVAHNRAHAILDTSGPFLAVEADKIELVTASYRSPIRPGVFLSASILANMGKNRSYAASLGLGFRFGGATMARLETSLDAGHPAYSASITKPVLRPNDYGYKISNAGGPNAHLSAELEYASPWANNVIAVDQRSGQFSGRAGMRGAVVLADADVFFSNRVDDSFAVVRTGKVPGIPIFYENRNAGVTNANGHLLVPWLRAYENNKLSLNVADLPMDISTEVESVVVRPREQSGIIVDFRVRKLASALLTLNSVDGKPIPIGAVVIVDGQDEQPVGQDGATYVSGLSPDNNMMVRLPNGSQCAVQFAFVAVKGDIPAIGPLVCR